MYHTPSNDCAHPETNLLRMEREHDADEKEESLYEHPEKSRRDKVFQQSGRNDAQFLLKFTHF